MRHVERLRRALARSGDGPLRPAWVGVYWLVARLAAAQLRKGNASASVYATSSIATGELVPGVSDLDLAVVVPNGGRPRVEQRRDRLSRLLGPLAPHLWVAVYEERDLERAQVPGVAAPVDRTLFFGADPLPDDLELGSRPGVQGRLQSWRVLAGADRRPRLHPRSRAEDRVAAWLELQAWWKWAVQAALEPQTPGRASLCVKLVAEACRIVLWLEHGEAHATRRAVLERALVLVPEERQAIEDALALQQRLAESPEAPLVGFLPVFVRLTRRVAATLTREIASAGSTRVQLLWGGPAELALPEAEPGSLPLADWRSIVFPTLPDECFKRVDGDPGDPATLAQAARAGSSVTYAAFADDELLVLPPSDVYWLGKYRCVHFPASDPVSFALLRGDAVAEFPKHIGWSIGDVAARAVAEHRGYLDAQLDEPGWDVQKLGLLLNAARAALLAESLDAGEPFLPLTVTETARLLGDATAEEAAALYRLHRREGGAPVDALVRELARVVRSLPAYTGADRQREVAWAT